jgi:hypothetical protein
MSAASGVDMSGLIDQIMQAYQSGAGAGVLDVLEQQGQVPAEQLALMREQMEKFASMSPEQIAEQLKKAMSEMGGADAAAEMMSGMDGMSASRGVLLAIQDPKGSYLLGWGAGQTGEKWIFTNAPAADGSRPRASAWDGIGPLGFVYTSMASGPAPTLMPDDLGGDGSGSPGSDGGGDAPSDSAPTAPTRKNTPAGPVTIPSGRSLK